MRPLELKDSLDDKKNRNKIETVLMTEEILDRIIKEKAIKTKKTTHALVQRIP
jgi:hypothetical protein